MRLRNLIATQGIINRQFTQKEPQIANTQDDVPTRERKIRASTVQLEQTMAESLSGVTEVPYSTQHPCEYRIRGSTRGVLCRVWVDLASREEYLQLKQ